MGLYRRHILPRLIDVACGSAELGRWRARVTEGLAGRVVEIGFGSGLNVPHYPAGVEVVLAVEPADAAVALAQRRIEASPVPVERVGLDGQEVALADASCDAALVTFTLCTIPDPARALAELRRIVRPGGRLHLLEHGVAPDASVRRWQQRLEPVQRRLADGCHLSRDPLALLTGAGFEPEWVDQRYARGPRPWSWFTAGVARNPG